MPADVGRLGRGQPEAFIEDAAKTAARQQLEHHEGDGVLAPVEHGGDVGMVERRRDLGFGAEPAEEPGVVCQRRVEDLHRDASPEPDVVGDVDAPAGAGADRREQPVPVGEHPAGEIGQAAQRHSRSRYRTRAWIPRHTGRLRSRRRWLCRPSPQSRSLRRRQWRLCMASGAKIAGGRAPGRRRTSVHPWRVVIVVGGLALVVSLVLVLGSNSDTSDQGKQNPNADIAQVRPAPGSIVNQLDDIEVRLRSGLTGVIVLNGKHIPENQLVIDNATSTISFRPGEGKEISRLPAGANDAAVLYWSQTQPEPAKPRSFGWSFRASA